MLGDILLVFYYCFHSFFLLGHEVTTRLRNYNVEEATDFVLERVSGSELSGFSEDSDTEDEIELLANTRDNDE